MFISPKVVLAILPGLGTRPTRRVQNTSLKHFCKKHKLLIYFSKNHCKLLNLSRLSDS